jgi:hypothetical protein
LRDLFAGAALRTLDPASLRNFAEKLARHIRKEERQLFEGMQKVMRVDELARVGTALERALADASNACILPTNSTRLRPKNPASHG